MLIWPSLQVGCGKSSLLAALLGELQPLLPLHRTAGRTAAFRCSTSPQPPSPTHAAATASTSNATIFGAPSPLLPLSLATGSAGIKVDSLPAVDHEEAHVVLDLGAAAAEPIDTGARPAPPQDSTMDLDLNLDLDLDQLAPVICGSIAYCSQVGLPCRSLRDHHGAM